MNLFERFDRLAPGAITTIAGLGYTDGVPARDADAGWPLGVVRLPEGHPHAGELIVNDYQGQRIWRIDRKGILHTFAGDGVPGNRGDDGPAARPGCSRCAPAAGRRAKCQPKLINQRIQVIYVINVVWFQLQFHQIMNMNVINVIII